MKTIGQALHEARIKAKLSQYSVAESIGVGRKGQSRISEIESDKFVSVGSKRIQRIADACGMAISYRPGVGWYVIGPVEQ